MMKTTFQNKSHVMSKAKGRMTVERLRQYSAAGYTKDEAAKALGIGVGGVDSALYRSEGSTVWPIA